MGHDQARARGAGFGKSTPRKYWSSQPVRVGPPVAGKKSTRVDKVSPCAWSGLFATLQTPKSEDSSQFARRMRLTGLLWRNSHCSTVEMVDSNNHFELTGLLWRNSHCHGKSYPQARRFFIQRIVDKCDLWISLNSRPSFQTHGGIIPKSG